MALSAATLSTALQSMTPRSSEADAIAALVNAYATHAEDAEAATAILSGGINLGKAAMSAALVGMSATGAGAAKMAGGIVAFWSAVAGGLATSFAGATAISPPFATLSAADIQPVFDANVAAAKSLSDACDAIAAAIYAKLAGGTVTVGLTVTPIT